MYTLNVLNPVAPVQGEISSNPLAPRSSSLEGKVIGLVWNGKANGDVALKRAAELIRQRVPDVSFQFYSGALPVPKQLMDKAKQEVDVAIGCTAD